MPQSEEGRDVPGAGTRTNADVALQSSRLAFVNGHRMPQRDTLGRLLHCQENFFAPFRQKMQMIRHFGDCIPDGVCNPVYRFRTNEVRALVQQYGAVSAFQLCRMFGCKRSVDILVDLLSAGIIHRQPYVRLAFAIKHGSGLAQTIVKRVTAAQEPEFMQEGIRPLAHIQLDADGRQAVQEIRPQEGRDALAMMRIVYRWKLAVITRKNEELVRERNATQGSQESLLHHKAFIAYQRVRESSVLDLMLQTRESETPMIELRSRYVSSGHRDGTVDRLKDSLDQIRLSCARTTVNQEPPLFTREVQSQLLDIALPFDEHFGEWEHVRPGSVTVQDGTVCVYSGSLATECSKDLPLSLSFLHIPVPVKERRPVNFRDRLLSFFGLLQR